MAEPSDEPECIKCSTIQSEEVFLKITANVSESLNFIFLKSKSQEIPDAKNSEHLQQTRDPITEINKCSVSICEKFKVNQQFCMQIFFPQPLPSLCF